MNTLIWILLSGAVVIIVLLIVTFRCFLKWIGQTLGKLIASFFGMDD